MKTQITSKQHSEKTELFLHRETISQVTPDSEPKWFVDLLAN